MKTMEDDILEKSDPSELATNDPDGNLRYVGADPDNYVWFNNELWRIIGVFDGQVKIIRNEYYSSSIAWDGNYIPDWYAATLQIELNETYLESIHTADSVSYSYIDLEHVWSLGGLSDYSTATRSDFYNAERSETISATTTDYTWQGAIGLMYPSDYGYSTSGASSTCDSQSMTDWADYSDCYLNSWLYDSSNYQWTITASSKRNGGVFYVNLDGSVHSDGESYTYGARPVLYLKSDVRIVDGLGTDTDPFILSQ